jgi:hypothetical protein
MVKLPLNTDFGAYLNLQIASEKSYFAERLRNVDFGFRIKRIDFHPIVKFSI